MNGIMFHMIHSLSIILVSVVTLSPSLSGSCVLGDCDLCIWGHLLSFSQRKGEVILFHWVVLGGIFLIGLMHSFFLLFLLLNTGSFFLIMLLILSVKIVFSSVFIHDPFNRLMQNILHFYMLSLDTQIKSFNLFTFFSQIKLNIFIKIITDLLFCIKRFFNWRKDINFCICRNFITDLVVWIDSLWHLLPDHQVAFLAILLSDFLVIGILKLFIVRSENMISQPNFISHVLNPWRHLLKRLFQQTFVKFWVYNDNNFIFLCRFS